MVHSINDSAWSWDKCLLLLSVVLCFGCSTQNEGPRARIEPSEVTIETSSSDDAGKIEFRISNIGTKAFNVLHFSASCGCTSTDIHPKHILPGKEAILTATVRPMNSGSLRVAVETITDIPDQKMLTEFINIKGKGKVPYIVSNSSLISFGTNVKQNDIKSFFVKTREMASDSPWIDAQLREVDGIEIRGSLATETPVGNHVVERHYEYQARMARALLAGEFRSHVVITGHSDKSHQEIRIPIQGTVLAPVQISPGALFGNFSNFEEIPVYTITFQNTQKTNGFKIEPPALNASRFAIEKLNESNELSTFRLRIVKAFGNELIDELVFQTGMIEMPEIRLPVRLLVRD